MPIIFSDSDLPPHYKIVDTSNNTLIGYTNCFDNAVNICLEKKHYKSVNLKSCEYRHLTTYNHKYTCLTWVDSHEYNEYLQNQNNNTINCCVYL